HWTVVGDEVSYNHHEGPNVFSFGGKNWMITDEWDGLGVYETADFCHFKRNGVILKDGGHRKTDGTKGHHADVLVNNGNAWIFYFCVPWDIENGDVTYGTLPASERSHHVVQAAKLEIVDGKLVCNRDADIELILAPEI
ncbi:MAG: glycosyl hydrolase, partial [Clostridia bacterium]|nr:glycosyl hydrolase [Clostridia bacterium]